jgi:UDP-glucose 4-epimerase
MRILVTGGAGFIGSHVVDVFQAAGHHVTVVDDLSHGRRENLPPGVTLNELDIRSPELADVFAEAKPQVVSHHAAQISVARSVQSPAEDAAVNVGGTANVLQQAVQHGVEKVLFASSVAVYGNPQYQPCDESHPTQPLSPYGLSKLVGEMYVQLFSSLYGLAYTILRYGNVYGPRQDAEGEAGVIALFVHKMLEGAPAVIDGDGGQTRDFVYVEDVASANLLALEAGHGQAINLGTGTGVAIRALWHTLRDLTGHTLEQVNGPPRPGDIRHMVISPTRAHDELGWQAQTELLEGLRRTVASIAPASSLAGE